MKQLEIIRGLHNIKPHHYGCVATIGNFDGLHRGHQMVIGQLIEKAQELRLPALVITFEPQPEEFFLGNNAPARLSRFREKVLALRRFALDRLLAIDFNQPFAAVEAEMFAREVLVEGLGIRYLVVGDDFRFGKGRHGDFTLLQQMGAKHGFTVTHMHTQTACGARISSTRIRSLLEQGRLDQAELLLGRPYRMSGRVAHGDKRGRQLGFPTANIHLHRKVAPLQGVFAIELFGIDGEPWRGVANIGFRPTVDGGRSLLEAHLFDFDGDLYGRHLHVDFLQRLRGERRFPSVDELRRQISHDCANARSWFLSEGLASE